MVTYGNVAHAKQTCSRLGYAYVSASSNTFQLRVNYCGTQLTASAVGNRGYVSPWGGANWLRRTAVKCGAAAVPRCTAMSSRCTVTIFTYYVYASTTWNVEENMKARHRRENEKAVNVTMPQPGIGAGGGEFLAVISQLCALRA